MLKYYLKAFFFLVAFLLIKVPFGIYILPAALILFMTPAQFKINALIFLNAFHVIFFGILFKDISYRSDRLINNILKLEIGMNQAFVFLIRAVALTLMATLVFFLNSKVRSKNPLKLFLFLFFLLMGMALVLFLFRDVSYLNLIIWTMIVLYSKYFWIILYNLRRESLLNYSNEKKVWSDFILFPFWSNITNYHSHNIPRYVKELGNDIVVNKKEVVNASFRTISFSLICSVLASTILTLTMRGANRYQLAWLPTYSYFNYVNANEVGLKNFNNMHYSSAEVWFIILIQGACFLFRNASMMLAIAAVIEFSGFRVASPIHNIQKANSFSDFMARYYYYYSDIIKTFFYYPLVFLFDQFPLRLWVKKFFPAFFGVFLGGFFIHFFIELARYIEMDSISEAFKYTVLLMPYIFFLSFFIALSGCLPRTYKVFGSYRFLFFFAFVLMYAVAYSTQVYQANIRLGLPIDIEDYFLFLKRLFLLS